MQISLGPVTIHFGTNGKYVKREECHTAHEKLEKYLDKQFADAKEFTNKRIDDLMKSVDNYISLLKQ